MYKQLVLSNDPVKRQIATLTFQDQKLVLFGELENLKSSFFGRCQSCWIASELEVEQDLHEILEEMQ